MDGIVPKVTAFTETAIVYAVMNGELGRARELVNTLDRVERSVLISQLTTVINMLWTETDR